MERIAMSQQERDELDWLRRAQEGSISQRAVAEKMGVSDRWVRKLLKRMVKEGDAVVVHGLRGRPSNRKLPAETQRQVVKLLKQPDWHDFGPTFASQQLAKRHGIEVSDETVRKWMIEAGLWQSKSQRVAYRCLHQSCRDKGWHAFRDLIEPGRHRPRTGADAEQTGQPGSWEPPIPFGRFRLPPFPTDIFPKWLQDFVEAEALATQTPSDLAGMLALSVLAAVCAKKVAVHVKPGYSEPVNLFTVTALPPGSRKSAVFAAITKPVADFEREEVARTAGEIAEQRSAVKIKEATLKKRQEAAVGASGKKLEDLTREAGMLAEELAQTSIPVPARLIVDDCTPEKLSGLLSDHGGRIALMSAEGDVFDVMAGRYSPNGGGNFVVYLKGHSGDAIRVDRVGRPAEFVNEPALTVGLAVQPDVIDGLAEKPGFRGRGLLGRFLYAMPISTLGYRDTSPPQVAPSITNEYHRNLLFLLKLPFRQDADGQPRPHQLALGADAQAAFQEFEAWLEPQLAEFGELGNMTDWAGKLAGAVARIAGLLHMADHTGAEAEALPMAAETVARAIRLARYLIPHATAAFDAMGADPVVGKAKLILRWIEHENLSSFTRRDAHQSARGVFKRVDEVDPALAILIDRGFIRRRDEPTKGSPGRPASPVYDVNPKWGRTGLLPRPEPNSEYCEYSEQPSPKNQLSWPSLLASS